MLGLVEHNELVGVLGQVLLRIIEPTAIDLGFKLETECRLLPRDDPGERRLPRLPRPEQDDGAWRVRAWRRTGRRRRAIILANCPQRGKFARTQNADRVASCGLQARYPFIDG